MSNDTSRPSSVAKTMEASRSTFYCIVGLEARVYLAGKSAKGFGSRRAGVK